MAETKARYSEGFTEVAPNVHVGHGEIVVTGQPSDVEDENDPAFHNCDAMGCGRCHVLYRAPLASVATPEPRAR
jgi:hypothetical protein